MVEPPDEEKTEIARAIAAIGDEACAFREAALS
jgi:hypothetical protein